MKLLKSVLCVLLALLMVVPGLGSAFAAETEEKYPMVYLAGFGDTNIYYEDDPEQKSLFFPLDTDRLLGNLRNVDDYILKSIKNREPDVLYTCLYSYLWDSFGMLRLNPDGSSVDGVVAAEVKLNHVGNGRYDFNYDCRKDPFKIAQELREYIETVKQATGSEKVELVASSYSANAALTYLKVYENELDDIDSVVLCVPSIGGISLLSEILAGEVNVSHKAFREYIGNLKGMEFFGDFMWVLDKAGVLEPLVESMLVPVLEEAIMDALMDISRDLIATIPAVWACITDEYFEKVMINMFGEDYNSENHEYAQLIENVTYYHENIKLKAKDILSYTKQNNADLHMAVVCKYGNPSIPLSKYEDVLTDGLVFIELSSFGATCANYGETLGESYTQAKYQENNLISPDRLIDASTCLFPFNTWFIKGLDHSQKNEDYHKVLAAVAHGDLDIYSDETYPQYLTVSPEDEERIIAYNPTEDEKPLTAFERFIDILKKIFLIPVNLFRKFFGVA